MRRFNNPRLRSGLVLLGIALATFMIVFANRRIAVTPLPETRFITDCITRRVIGKVPVALLTYPFDQQVELKAHETGTERQASFQDVYKSKLWGEKFDADYKGITGSGPGSTLRYSQEAIAGLHIIISDIKAQFGLSRIRILDIPCGDMAWMSRFLSTRDDIDYTGMDIVPELINNHKKAFAQHPWKFVQQDIAEHPLNQSYDIIFCRMMLQHLHTLDVLKILKRFSDSGSRVLLTTSFYRVNVNIQLPETGHGRFRMLNLEIPPFSLVPPRCMFRDGEGASALHFLGLWELPLRKISGCKNVTSFELIGRGVNIFSCTDWTKNLSNA